MLCQALLIGRAFREITVACATPGTHNQRPTHGVSHSCPYRGKKRRNRRKQKYQSGPTCKAFQRTYYQGLRVHRDHLWDFDGELRPSLTRSAQMAMRSAPTLTQQVPHTPLLQCTVAEQSNMYELAGVWRLEYVRTSGVWRLEYVRTC